MVEAKAHLKEIESQCQATKGGVGLEMIEAVRETKEAVGVDSSADWLKPYYQYANREGVPNSVEGLRRRSVCGSPYATSSRVSKRGSSRTAFRIHRSR